MEIFYWILFIICAMFVSDVVHNLAVRLFWRCNSYRGYDETQATIAAKRCAEKFTVQYSTHHPDMPANEMENLYAYMYDYNQYVIKDYLCLLELPEWDTGKEPKKPDEAPEDVPATT